MKNTHTLISLESPTNWAVSGTLPKFDPALGTLTGVRIVLTSDASSRFRVESRETQPTAPEVFSNVITATNVDGVNLEATVALQHSQTLAAHDGAIDFAGPSGFDTVKTGAESVSVSFDPGAAAGFIGSGTLGVSITSSASSGIQNIGASRFNVTTKSQASVMVEYEFTPAA